MAFAVPPKYIIEPIFIVICMYTIRIVGYIEFLIYWFSYMGELNKERAAFSIYKAVLDWFIVYR